LGSEKTERGAYDVREKFLELAEQVRLIFLRNGAFFFNIDENLEYPGTLRTEMLLSSWAEHLLQLSRMTKSKARFITARWRCIKVELDLYKSVAREYAFLVCRKTDIDVNFNCCVLGVSASYLLA
jgi:hypothetical protein